MILNTDYKLCEICVGFIIEFTDGVRHLEEQICQALERANVGRFYGGGELRFERKSDTVKKLVLSVLDGLSIDELTGQHNEWEACRRIERDARKAFLALTLEQFLSKIETISNQKLMPILACGQHLVGLKPDALMPVTHFKKLAKIGRWNGKSGRFEYTLPLTPQLRDNLYAAAYALGRSTKKVTAADIAARRAKVAQSHAKLDMDFNECREDFGLEYAIEMQRAGRLVD